MLRLFDTFLPRRTLVLAITEALVIVLSLYSATLPFLNPRPSIGPNYDYDISKIFVASSVCLLCMYYYDLYDSPLLGNPREVMARLVQVLGTTSVILALMYYVYPRIELRRSTLLLGIVLVGACLALWRELFFVLNRSPHLVERAILLGDGPLSRSLAREIGVRPELGVRLVGYLGQSANSSDVLPGLGHLGGLDALGELAATRRIDRVIVTMSDSRGRLPVELLLRLKTQGVRIQDGADVYEAVTGKVPLASLRLSWLLFSPGFTVSPAVRVYKRTFAILGSLIVLVLAWPLMLLIGIAIRLDSEGPVIFRQQRMGQNGKIFVAYKFRSMRHGLQGESAYRAAQKNDDRVTRVGRWLRRTRLDELPQLFNVLRGDIDFVGPRPFVPEQERELMEKIPFYPQRLSIKPGVTGWAQVNRGYCETIEDNKEKLAYDLFYIKNVSVALDMLIMFSTVKTLLLGRGGR